MQKLIHLCCHSALIVAVQREHARYGPRATSSALLPLPLQLPLPLPLLLLLLLLPLPLPLLLLLDASRSVM